MSCPIPLRIINPKYKKIASLSDNDKQELSSYEGRDDYYIDVPCGKCYHCRKTYKTQWMLRLQHHYQYLSREQQNNSYFITLTFDDDYVPKSTPTKPLVAPLIRKFLEPIRKHFKRSVTHWIVSEYGSTTKRYHLHGILFDVPFPIWQLSDLWKYGYVSYRKLSSRRITYITTYITKLQKGLLERPNEKQDVFCSPGIGKAFTEDIVNYRYAYQHDTIVPFLYYNKRPFAMPRYYRGKMFDPDQLEDLKESYFHFLSDDVIPPPPYYLGNMRYYDYTVYRAACDRLRSYYNELYRKSKSNNKSLNDYGKQQSQSDFPTS